MPASKPSISRALTAALKACPQGPERVAVVALARRLAFEMDQAENPDVVARLSAKLLPVLGELGMGQPKAVAGSAAPAAEGGVQDVARAFVDELRDRRRARADRAAAVDAAAR